MTDSSGNRSTVMVYTMNSPYKECPTPPSEGYLGGIMEGCLQNGIDPSPIQAEAGRLVKEKAKQTPAHTNKKASREAR